MADIRVSNHGSVALLHPVSARGWEWVESNVNYESWQVYGRALACEPRYVADVVEGARNDGLEVV